MKQTILILADNLASGGARLAENILKTAAFLDFQIIVLHSDNLNLSEIDNKISFIEKGRSNPIKEVFIRSRIINKIKPDYVLNLTNFPLPKKIPIFKCEFSEILLFQNLTLIKLPPLSFTDFFKESFLKILVRLLFFKLSVFLSDASCVVVQTHWVSRELAKRYPSLFRKSSYVAKSIIEKRVLSHEGNASFLKNSWFYPAAFYFHKRHWDLIELGELLQQKGLDVQILVTIPGKTKEERKYLDEIRRRGLENVLINVGWLGLVETHNFYLNSKGLFFPSDFETLGLPVLEAMAYNKPIVAADIPTTREITRGKAHFFDWNSPNCLEVIAGLLSADLKIDHFANFDVDFETNEFLEYFYYPAGFSRLR